ncbi:uncharacterized protein EI90DRAFT_3059252 [Cantharellus anzutake]|uniref:uncharacterized protein n=1 Tax=Cantharellus anzutake TaxID=1750568 RepID=UPI001908A810|nr:uncharacterized protein EI90DRAFT_3059252 [Cantharellus anzutake]KAF8330780.1 hypothetical protein EI90DRAFT_3059252 [Cantharellus anzutake]
MDITVHQFVQNDKNPGSSIIDDGVSLVASAFLDLHSWTSVSLPDTQTRPPNPEVSLWTLRDAPPMPPRQDLPQKPRTPEWDAPFTEAEDEGTSALEPFRGLDVSFLDSLPRKRAPMFSLNTDKPSKRRRGSEKDVFHQNRLATPARSAPIVLVPASASPSAPTQSSASRIEILSASSIVPEPHVICSPAPLSLAQGTTNYGEIPKHPIHSFLGSIETSISSHPLALPWDAKYARGSWLIPVRGPPAHSLASCGCLLPSIPSQASPKLLESTHPPPTDAKAILWTPELLLKFWDFLILMRAKGVLGPIAIFLEIEGLVHRLNPGVRGNISDQKAPRIPEISAVFQSSQNSTSYSGEPNEWIRLVCDGKHALRIRTILDSFKGSWPSLTSSSGSDADRMVSKTRGSANSRHPIIRGSLLVYTDDLGRPLFLA